MKNFFRLDGAAVKILAPIAFAFITGCVSSGALHSISPLDVSIDKYHSIIVSVTSLIPGAEDEERKLCDNIVSKLREQGIFKDVWGTETTDEAMCELRMVAKIVKLRRLSKQSRGMFGIFAGRAGITVDTQLEDRSTGEQLCTFQVEGRSSNHSVFAGMTDQAIDKAAVQVVNYIRNQKHIDNK